MTLITSKSQQITLETANQYLEHTGTIPCLRCGTCCTKWQPQLGEDELPALAQGLGLSLEAFCQKYVYIHPALPQLRLLKREGDACVLLRYDDGGLASCAVHPFKPATCRNWSPRLSRPECQKGLKKRKP